MQAQNAKANWIEQHPLLLALAISLALHVVLFFFGGALLSMAILKNPDLLKQIAQSPERIIELTAQELRPSSPKLAQERQMPMLFIEVDPSKAVKEAPENTKFYSAQSTLASNPDTKIDSELPKIDGKQTQITRAFEAPRSQPKPAPLQPSPAQQAKVESQPQKETPDKIREQAKQVAKPKVTEQREKNTDLAKQETGELDPKKSPQESVAESAPVPPARPKNLSEARLRQSDTRPPGEKMKQEGGVRSLSSDFSFSAKGTPLGDYDARIVDAIRTKWYALLDQTSHAGDRKGHVTIEFRLYSNGAVRNVKTTEEDVGDLLSYICQNAIITPAPYEKWPEAVRGAVGQDYRDVKFTFFYN